VGGVLDRPSTLCVLSCVSIICDVSRKLAVCGVASRRREESGFVLVSLTVVCFCGDSDVLEVSVATRSLWDVVATSASVCFVLLVFGPSGEPGRSSTSVVSVGEMCCAKDVSAASVNGMLALIHDL
jgi:hypothetical protein